MFGRRPIGGSTSDPSSSREPRSQSRPTSISAPRGSKRHSAVDPAGDPFRLQNFSDGLGDVLVLARDEARPLFDHGDLRPEATKHLREFQPNIAAAHHDQASRQAFERHHIGVGEDTGPDLCRALRDIRPAADIDEDTRRGEPILVDGGSRGPMKRAWPRMKVQSLQALQPRFKTLAEPR